MARVFDVVEYPDPMRNELVHRLPESGPGNFRIGSQVIVREGQVAVFMRDGRALDSFAAGRHTISTGNIPLLIDLIGKAFDGRTPFPAEVYFVNTREFPDVKWGTPQPIIVKNAGMGLGVLPRGSAQIYRDALSIRLVALDAPWARRRLMLCLRADEVAWLIEGVIESPLSTAEDFAAKKPRPEIVVKRHAPYERWSNVIAIAHESHP